MNTTFIYGLKEKGGKIRYVGKSNNPRKRFKQHLNSKRENNSKSHKNSWITHCKNNGIDIEMVILEEVEYDKWQDKEVYWISKYDNLTNHDQGGKGGKGGKPIKFEMSYDDAKNYMKEHYNHIDTQSKFNKIKNELPNFISPYPRDTYLYRGWISWGDFLGTNRIADHKREFLSYDDAKQYLKDNYPNVKSSRVYRNTKFPNFIHKKPWIKYKDEWKGWSVFLNRKN